MSDLPRAGSNKYEAFQALVQGVTEQLTTDAAEDFMWIDIGLVPDAATGTRFSIMPNVPEVFSIPALGKVSVVGPVGATADLSAAVAAGVTVIRVVYKKVAGIVEVMQGGTL